MFWYELKERMHASEHYAECLILFEAAEREDERIKGYSALFYNPIRGEDVHKNHISIQLHHEADEVLGIVGQAVKAMAAEPEYELSASS